jgi:peptidoglycan/xylan/chitin deacetylase (PgdA/CDA1 family)
MAAARSTDGRDGSGIGLLRLQSLQIAKTVQTRAIRRAALVILVLLVGLGIAGGAYFALLREPEHASATTTTESVTTTPPPTKPHRRRISGPHNRPVPILMYHVVGPRPRAAAFPDLYVSRRDFASQLRWLASEGYHAVTLHSVYRYWRGRERLPSRPIVLSFDDGYRAQFTIAAPILRRHRWPGVLNLEYAHLVHEDLTGPMIRRLLAEGWELASHTLTHPNLTAVDPVRLRRELALSRQLLQRRFGVRVDFFCYPGGAFDGRVVSAVRAAGYRGATTTQFGLARRSQPFTLARIRVDTGDGPVELDKKLAEAGAAAP